MQVIAQLIQHFRQRGALSKEQLAYLEQQGFVTAPEIQHADNLDDDDDIYGTERDALYDQEQAALDSKRPARSKGSRKPKAKVLKATAIGNRLRKVFEERATILRTLVVLADRLTRCDSWSKAALLLSTVALWVMRRRHAVV